MKKPISILLLSFLIALFSLPMQGKKVLGHDDFDHWKRLVVGPVSDNGVWASYMANEQEGDGTLVFYNTNTGKKITVPRGYNPTFSANGKWAVALIKPLFSDTRQGKIDKKKDFDLPQDSLAIVNLATNSVERIPNVISYKIGEEGGEVIAYLSSDTTFIKPGALKDKEAGKPMIVRSLPNADKNKVVNWVQDYVFSKDGNKLAFSIKPQKNDSIVKQSMNVMSFPDTSYHVIDYDAKFYGTPVFDRGGRRLAYTMSQDTVASGTKACRLFTADLSQAQPRAKEIVVERFEGEAPRLQRPHAKDPAVQAELEKKYDRIINDSKGRFLRLNQYSKPDFSYSGNTLFIGIAPEVAPDDTTLVDFELPTLDIWRWDAPLTPPQENKLVEEIRKNTFPVAIDMNTLSTMLVTSNDLSDVAYSDRGDGEWVLVIDPTENMVSRQWDYLAPKTLLVKNLKTGEERVVSTEIPKTEGAISPKGKYVTWYADRNYHVYDIATGNIITVGEDIPYPLWNESQDIPLEREAYGVMGWTENDGRLLVYDNYDVWALDPTGKSASVNVTKEEGRKNKRRYRYIKTDEEEQSIKAGQNLLLSVFDTADKRHGFATMKYSDAAAAPSLRSLEEYDIRKVKKAKNADVYAYQKANFSTSPDLWVAKGNDFAKATKVSDINPQMKDYNWGTAELVKWYAYNGVETEGVLYKPEDFDPAKKYPMMVVFYETGSEDLYYHYEMEPSWSWINYPFYVSRGYLVFQPDVHYAPGIPGESAYNYICSGVEDLVKKYPWVDKDKIGIDGQSWGGYQTAYLVTRTNMFACAGSGAPVSNMTSAFGGIRWGTGDSRQGQYEQGQSRIGRNLWETPQLYIANSPLFYADRIETPLLIMHNDQDGAVPWYQGIELFMALRRLHKPVWMLTYNGEAHNLKERRNRKDITKRLQQFFDHYLKDEPMPKWMKEGIPAVRKGQEFGY